jgi:hypothetical protein
MPKDEASKGTNFKKVRATELPKREQERLRNVLREELTEALIKTLRSEPPEVDLGQIDVVLRPGQQLGDWDVVADCSTCSTCSTCGTCGTCQTAALPPDLPMGIARDLGLEVPRVQVDVKGLRADLERINTQLAAIERSSERHE